MHLRVYAFADIMLRGSDATGFYRGMLIGLGTLPAAQLIGGAVSGIGVLLLTVQTLPATLFSILLMRGLKLFAKQAIPAFSTFATLLRWLSILGLTAGAVQYIADTPPMKRKAQYCACLLFRTPKSK